MHLISPTTVDIIQYSCTPFANTETFAGKLPRQHTRLPTELGGYLDLIVHINTHRYYMGLEQRRDISRDEAVMSWYDHVYMPVIQTIRQEHVLQAFPGRTEADLYRWIMQHRWFLRERSRGKDPGPRAATEDYVEHFGRKSLIEMTRRLLLSAFS